MCVNWVVFGLHGVVTPGVHYVAPWQHCALVFKMALHVVLSSTKQEQCVNAVHVHYMLQYCS